MNGETDPAGEQNKNNKTTKNGRWKFKYIELYNVHVSAVSNEK